MRVCIPLKSVQSSFPRESMMSGVEGGSSQGKHGTVREVSDRGGRSSGAVDLISSSDAEVMQERRRDHALLSREPIDCSWQPVLRSRVLVDAICTVSLPIFELGQIGAHRC